MGLLWRGDGRAVGGRLGQSWLSWGLVAGVLMGFTHPTWLMFWRLAHAQDGLTFINRRTAKPILFTIYDIRTSNDLASDNTLAVVLVVLSTLGIGCAVISLRGNRGNRGRITIAFMMFGFAGLFAVVALMFVAAAAGGIPSVHVETASVWLPMPTRQYSSCFSSGLQSGEGSAALILRVRGDCCGL